MTAKSLFPAVVALMVLVAGVVAAEGLPLTVVHVTGTTRMHTFRDLGTTVASTTIPRGLAGLKDGMALPNGAPVWLYIDSDVAQDLGPSPRTRLAEVVRDLAAAGVEVRTAQVLTPWDEAAFTWYAVNRARGSLDAPVGVLHLDNGRLLFAFVPSRSDTHAARPFIAGAREFTLYAATYSGLASLNSREEARCYPPGMSVHLGQDFWVPSNGDADLCQRVVFATLASRCPTPPCSLMGTPQPPVTGQFVAWGDFATIGGLHAGSIAPDSFLTHARHDCATRWTHAWLTDPSVWRSPMACHEAVMVATVLGPGLGFRGNTRRIELTTPAASTAPLWAHGVVAARALDL